VAETLVKRTSLRDQAQYLTLVVAALFSGLVIATMWVAVSYSLRSLSFVRDELEHRSLQNLSRLDSARAPAEVRPLVATVNQLFDRLQVAAAAQRAFISDAAHQLRTPLAALRTESELALLEPHPAAMRPMLLNLRTSADRAAHLASQLLTLARLDPEARSLSEPVAVDLMEVAADAAREWSARAFALEADLGFDLGPAIVSGQKWLLGEALSNLIHNALEYCPRPACITVRTGIRDGVPELAVEDDGPGIAPPERERVLQRFVRGQESPGQGSGLGLAIVAQIAELHDAELLLEVPESGLGLLVRLRFPGQAGRAR
jgi:two-component system sensor histidine kinase TctE